MGRAASTLVDSWLRHLAALPNWLQPLTSTNGELAGRVQAVLVPRGQVLANRDLVDFGVVTGALDRIGSWSASSAGALNFAFPISRSLSAERLLFAPGELVLAFSEA